MMAMENRPLIDELPIQSGDFHSYSLPEAMSIEDSYPWDYWATGPLWNLQFLSPALGRDVAAGPHQSVGGDGGIDTRH